MNKKFKSDKDGIMYSTDQNYVFDHPFEAVHTLLPGQQKLIIRLETKQRGGKKATLIKGFTGNAEDLESLAKKLKSHCGSGGSVVDGEILIQGDMCKKCKEFLRKEGYQTNNI